MINKALSMPVAVILRRQNLCATVIGLVVALAGCTHQGVYESTKANRLAECNRLEGREREQCLAQYEMSYQEYKQKREEVVTDEE